MLSDKMIRSLLPGLFKIIFIGSTAIFVGVNNGYHPPT